MGDVLGVDLGTTFTAAAVASGSARPTMVGLGNRALQVPSVLFRTDSGFLVGESAERRALTEPDRVVREFKRRLGDDVPVLVDGVPVTPEQLMATLLAWVLARSTERMGEAPAELVLTHPAGWQEPKLERLRRVAELAGAPPTRFCPEPTAAAAQYASRARVAPGDRLAVYDLGGGTFDVCVLEQTTSGFRVLGTPEGVEHLGGVDFDALLFGHVLASLGDAALPDPGDLAATNALHRLRRDCVDAKEALSSDVETTVPVALPGLVTSVRVTRGELESLVRPSVEESITALARALRWAGVEPSALHAIILVGGSSRIPLVGELLQAAFRVPVALDTHPKHDIALGAVRVAREAASAAPLVRPAPAAATPPPAHAPSPAPRPVEPPRAAPPRAARPTAARPAAAAPAAPPPPPPAAPPPAGAPRPAAAAVPAVAARAAAPPPAPPAAPVAPPSATPPGPTAPVPPEVLTIGDAPPARRSRWMVAVPAAVAVLVAGVSGVVWWNRSHASPGAGVPASPTAPLSTAAPSPSPEVDGGLPASDPLAPDQLVVSVQRGGNWDLWLGSTTQPAPQLRLTSDPAPDTTPALSPDRRTVIYTHDLDGDGHRALMVKAAGTAGDGRPLWDTVPSECAGTVFRPAWDPVRRDRLAVPCVDARGTYGLYVVTTGGQVVRRLPLPAGTGRVDDPSFAPDGSRVVYWAAPPSTWEGGTLYTVGVDSGSPRRLAKTTRDGEDADAVWSPDGRSILFRRRFADGTTTGNFDIVRIAADGSGPLERLTKDTADEQDPVWSPSGDQVAFKSSAEDPARRGKAVNRTWVMDADGGHARPLWSQGPDDQQTTAAWGRR